MFGSPETTPGGRALKFYSSVRLDLRRIASIKKGEEVIGIHVRAKVVKNKVAPPFKKAEFDILYTEGISRISTSVDLADKLGVIARSGSWLTYDGERLGQGKDNARIFLKENPRILTKLEKEILAKAKEK